MILSWTGTGGETLSREVGEIPEVVGVSHRRGKGRSAGRRVGLVREGTDVTLRVHGQYNGRGEELGVE
jgi:hypothetical protein